ncbi:hypothetical protein MKZ38_010148 [Zalerion maritima]|uniref:N-acetyltransferase domain-containing protein n=1 Tax=Zalerion maritima TaxID=339359 RepID=A0AAD5RUG1_9PEZI|nr:hypothetical protein MKZ38_010148 [Zalerion maritima]
MSILNFLSRGSSGPSPSASQRQPQSHIPTRAPKVNAPPAGIPPPLNRYAPPPGSRSPVSTASQDSNPRILPSIALTPSASVVPISESHIPTLRTLNQITLPVQYGDKFYAAVLSRDPSDSGLYSRIILAHPAPSAFDPNPDPIVVGALVCRTEVSPFQTTRSPSELALYIQSLALFSPYRGQGLMGLAVKEILRYAASNPPEPGCRITDAFAHVWTENEEGLRWYDAQGFEKVGEKPIEGYYHRLRPGTAWILRRRVKVGDLLSQSPGTASASNGEEKATASTTTNGTPPARPTLSSTGSGLSVVPPRTSNGPPTSGQPSPAPSGKSGKSFQNLRPNMEWNDLPVDMVTGNSNALSAPPRPGSSTGGASKPPSATGSATSSRSSSVAAGKKKKTRGYPDAAFKS